MKRKQHKHKGDGMQRMTLVMTVEEIEYLKSLLRDEVFQLSGMARISPADVVADELKVAEQVEKKIEEAKLVAA